MMVRTVRRHERGRRRAALRRATPAALVDAAAAKEEFGAGQRPAVRDITNSLAPALQEASARITPEALLAFARETYAIRRRRDRHLPGDLFGEPTWDILLDLYVATRENRSVPTTSACIGANVPPTTALRWLRILEARELVEREEDDRDGRRTFVRLSARGLAAMDDYLHVALATVEHGVGSIMRRSAPVAEAAE
ncbi:winged helix DNA-binding protein [Novosphingobium sp.]|uniref:winged helix DNA-binding protein n=1 Tax=Novosphingobium sp. TaxID=1874826 RepID=UPI003BAD798E